MTYVPSKKQKFNNYLMYLWTITKSSSLKLNLHNIIMVLLSLLNWKHNVHKYWYMSDIVRQIKLSNTEKCAYNNKETSSEFKNSVSLNVQQNGESYKCLYIPKITIKCEFIPDPKHVSIINVYAPTNQLTSLSGMFLYSGTSTTISALFSMR